MTSYGQDGLSVINQPLMAQYSPTVILWYLPQWFEGHVS